MKNTLKSLLPWVALFLALTFAFNHFSGRTQVNPSISYSNFIAALNQGNVKQVSIDGNTITGLFGDGDRFTTYDPGNPHLVDDLLKNHVDIKVLPPERPSFFMQILISWFPMLLLIGVWISSPVVCRVVAWAVVPCRLVKARPV